MKNILITLVVATMGGIFGSRFKIPAGALVFSMLSVAIFSLLIKPIGLPQNFKIGAQIIIGSIIGSGFNREILGNMVKYFLPVLVSVLFMLSVSIFVGFLFHKITGLDLATALFSTAPGGLTDMVLIADELGAKTGIVVMVHFIRLVTVISFFPIIIKKIVS